MAIGKPIMYIDIDIDIYLYIYINILLLMWSLYGEGSIDLNIKITLMCGTDMSQIQTHGRADDWGLILWVGGSWSSA